MRRSKFSSFVVIILLLPFAYINPIFAQENNKQFVEIGIGKKKEFFFREAKVPFTKNPYEDDGRTLIEGEFYFAGIATVDCNDCYLSSEYDILSYAKKLNENSSEIYISINFKNRRKCSIKDKKFVIQQGKKEEFNLKCGVKLNTYYE